MRSIETEEGMKPTVTPSLSSALSDASVRLRPGSARFAPPNTKVFFLNRTDLLTCK